MEIIEQLKRLREIYERIIDNGNPAINRNYFGGKIDMIELVIVLLEAKEGD